MKKILAMLLCVGMVASLAACGLGATQAPSTSTPAPAPSAPAADGDEWTDVGPYASSAESQGKTNPMVIKISNGGGETSPVVQGCLVTFAPEVENASKGRIGVEVYANAQIGDDTTASEMVIAGQLECAVPSTAPLMGYVPELGVFDIPFLFADEAEADYILSSEVADYLDGKLLEKGIVNLAWAENGFRELTNSKKPVTCVADLSGLKIRTMENKFHQELWNSLGATATPMSSSELYTALEQGTVDGEENPIANLYAYQFQEVQDYITMSNHIYSPFMVIYSKTLWDGYDQEAQDIIRAGAQAYGVSEKAINREQAGICLQSCIDDYGIEVTYLTDEAKQEFLDKTAHIQDMVAANTGSEIMDLLNAAKASYKG